MNKKLILLLAPVCMAYASAGYAELRCDCSQIIESCSAEVTLEPDGEIEVETSSDACSRVDYLIDGQPFTALVIEGEAEFDWRGSPQARPQVIVENCRICADTVVGNVPADTTSAPLAESRDETDSADDAGSAPRALVKVMPDYPRDAWRRSVEGTVTVEFAINDNGVVQNIKVIESSNPVFVTPAIDAVSRFRFAPEAANGVRETFTFRLLDGIEPVVSSAEL